MLCYQALGSLKVDKLVIPAVPELMDTWTKGFGFTPVRESARKTIKNLNLVVFPGVDMLEKSLAKDKGINCIAIWFVNMLMLCSLSWTD